MYDNGGVFDNARGDNIGEEEYVDVYWLAKKREKHEGGNVPVLEVVSAG